MLDENPEHPLSGKYTKLPDVLRNEWASQMMLNRIRASLQARLEGRNEGGDIEVMRLVDELVEQGQRRGYARGMHDHGGRHHTERDHNPDIDDGC